MAKKRRVPASEEALGCLLRKAWLEAYLAESPAETKAHWHELALGPRRMLLTAARALLRMGVRVPENPT